MPSLVSRRPLFVAVAASMLAMSLMACGSKSPTGPSGSVSLAEHFDSLIVQAQDSDYYDLATALAYPTAVLAAGVQPVSVTMTIGNGSSKLSAVAVDDVILDANTGQPTDSAYYIVAWLGRDVSQLFYVQYSQADQFGGVDQIVGNADEASTAQTISASITSSGATCSIVDLAGIYSLIQGATCTTAHITASFTATFPANEGVATSVSFPTTDLPSIRLVETPTHVP